MELKTYDATRKPHTALPATAPAELLDAFNDTREKISVLQSKLMDICDALRTYVPVKVGDIHHEKDGRPFKVAYVSLNTAGNGKMFWHISGRTIKTNGQVGWVMRHAWLNLDGSRE